MKFNAWLSRLMAGRHGTDRFNLFLTVAAAVFLLISLFMRGSMIGSLIWAIGLVLLAFSVFRSLSRNSAKREAENQKYMQLTGSLRSSLNGWRSRYAQRKTYCFYKCPSCKTWLRVPRGKGKVNVTCRHCGERFTKKT